MEPTTALASTLATAAELPLLWVMARLFTLGKPLTRPDKRPLGIQ